MLYTTIDNGYQLQQLFVQYGRGNTFTAYGYDALYEMLEERGQDIEIDVISLCCEYCESSIEDIIQDYRIELDEDDEDIEKQVIDYLSDETSAILLDNGNILYQQF